jgi:cobalt-zinc-cadmium efflux system outer membrane protein
VRFLVAAALLALLAAPATFGAAVDDSALRTLTLDDAIHRAVDVGPDQAVAQAIVPIARADVRSARMLPNPTMAFSAGRAEPVFSATLSLRLPIFGQRGAHIDAAVREASEAEANATVARWRLRHDARISYYIVVRALDEVAIAQQIEQLTARVAAMAAERFDAGAGNRLEKEQAALLHVRAQQDVLDRQTAARVAQTELTRLLGLPADPLPALADPLARVGATPALAQLLAAADAHPDIVAADRERASALARAQAARADRRPTPQLDIGAELLDPQTCGTTERCAGPRGGLTFDLPVLNLNGGPIARAEAEARLAELKRVAAARRIEAGVRAAFDQWSAATMRARFFDLQYVPTARSVEQMAREGFAAGRTGLLPLIEAERALLDAQLARIDALYAVQAARADLEESSGVALSAP